MSRDARTGRRVQAGARGSGSRWLEDVEDDEVESVLLAPEQLVNEEVLDRLRVSGVSLFADTGHIRPTASEISAGSFSQT
jgi:hypothetical protein